MKPVLLFTLLLFACHASFSQTYQRQWLVGGNGTFYTRTATTDIDKSLKTTGFTLNPNAGFFVVNNLAIGARIGYDRIGTNYQTTDSTTSKGRTETIGVSPFVRYYFLPAGKKINVLADAAYGWSVTNFGSNGDAYRQRLNGLDITAGPVWFVMPSAALSLLANYQHTNAPSDKSNFSVNLGFEIHLGKGHRKKTA